MTIRPKTIRRLLALAAGAVVICGTIGIVFTARRFARDAQIAEARQVGLNAFESRQYSKALESLNRYILSRPNDVEALYALGCARMAMETPYRDYLYEARLRFQQLLVIEPTHQGASLKLLEVYDKTNQNTEMLELAHSVLSRTPGELPALRYSAIALTRLKRPTDARKAWESLVALAPGDVNAQSQLLVAMRAEGIEAQKVIEYAQKLVDDHPGDARFQIPLAVALRDAGRETESLAVLKKLTTAPPTDPDAVYELVTLLDRAGAFTDAEHVLEQAARTLQSSTLSTALVQRVWQSGNPQAVVVLTDKLIADGRAQPTALALRALSLNTLKQPEQAKALVSQLAAGDSTMERAWSEALRVEFAETPLSPPQQVEALSGALGLDPNNGILYTWLARALVQVGELDQAARCYREAAQRMPSWTTPCLELAQAMLSVGRNDEAIPAAKAAYLRSPTSVAVAVQLARVRYATLLQQYDPAEQTLLLKYVSSLRESLPDEPTLLPIHIALLARSGDTTGASTLLSAALAKKPSSQAILSLYMVDQQYSLGKSDAILRCATDANQVSSELSTLQAASLLAQGRTADATNLADALASRATESSDAALAEARIRTLLGGKEAVIAWRTAATRFPKDLKLQMAVLKEGVDQVGDRAFQAELIARVRKLTGENALYWRIEQAKFLAASDKPDDWRQALTVATELLRQQPTRTDLRVLLGRVLTRLDSRATALEHLRAAYEQAPSDAVVGLELVQAFLQLGRINDASAVLKRISQIDMEDVNLRNRVAASLIDNGMTSELLTMLQRAHQRHFLDVSGTLLLAETLANNDQKDAAAELYQLMLAKDPSPSTLASAAAFERESGRPQAAMDLLKRIDQATGTASSRQYAIARYFAKFGEMDAARKAFALTVDDPACTVAMFRDAIALECTTGNVNQGLKLLDLAQRRFGPSRLLHRTELELTAIRDGNSPAAMDRLLTELASDPDAKAEVEALRAAMKMRDMADVTPEMAVALVQLANRYPAAFDLQRQAVTACVATNQGGPAIAIAYRLSQLSPTRADVQALAAKTLAQFGQWNGARKIAERWRALEPQTPRDADLLLSAIAQATGKSAEALQLAEPYLSSLDPARDFPAIAARAAALRSVGRTRDCFEWLTPWLEQNAAVRSLWIDIVLQSPPDEAPARLEKLARILPADAAAERIRLAAACLDMSEGLEGDQAATLGLALVTAFAEGSSATEETRVLRAELLRVCNEPQLAEKELRSVLERTPGSVRAKNSLAYLLLTQSKSVDEALRLASEAAAAMPGQPNVLDTQARAMMASGDLEGANRVFGAALRLDPDSLDLLIGMATLRNRQGSHAEAQNLVSRVDDLLKRNSRQLVPAHLRGELGMLRQILSSDRD